MGERTTMRGTGRRGWLRLALLSHKLKEPLTAEDTVLLMLEVKIAREVHKPKHDNRVDICGYTECLDMIINERQG